MRKKAGKQHILAKKSTKRKRNLRQPTEVDKTHENKLRKLMPYHNK